MREVLKKIKSITARMPIIMIIVIVLCMSLKEFFPFSHFPMYSGFDPWAYYLYVTDKDDNPIAINRTFKFSAPKFKKMFIARRDALKRQRLESNIAIDDEELERSAAALLLEDVFDDTDPAKIRKYEQLKVYITVLTVSKEGIDKKSRLLAEKKI